MERTTKAHPERHVQVDQMSAGDVGKQFGELHPTMTGPPCTDFAWQRRYLKQLPVDPLVLLGQKTRSLKKATKDHEEAEAENQRLQQVAERTQQHLEEEQKLTKQLREEKAQMQKELNAAEAEKKELASRLKEALKAAEATKVEAKKRKTDEKSSSTKKRKTSETRSIPVPTSEVITAKDRTPKQAKTSPVGKIMCTPDVDGYWLVLGKADDGLHLAQVVSNGDVFETASRYGKNRWRVHEGSDRCLLTTMSNKWECARATKVAKQGLLVEETWEVYPQKEKK